LQSVKSDTLLPWHEGIIGLIASKLLERYYRPVIVFTHAEEKINARGEVVPTYKASARSIPGLHLANLLQSLSHHLLSHGGHAAAAGLSMDTRSFDAFCIDTLKATNTLLTEDNLIRPVHADAHISITHTTNTTLLDAISAWAPFGIGNSKPTFVSHAHIKDIRTIGASGTHLKLTLTARPSDPSGLEGVLFGKAAEYTHLAPQDQINVVYTLDWNIWRGTKTIQAKIITLLSDEDKV
jgi:single-stranded-DNA-specific exonuclease